MRAAIGILAVATVVLAQSPHVFSRNQEPGFDAQLHHLSIGGVTKLSSNGSAGFFLRKRVQDPEDPTPDEMDGRTPPWFPMLNCLGCPPPPGTDPSKLGDALLKTYTTDYFAGATKATLSDLIDTCVFYTKGLDIPRGPSNYLERPHSLHASIRSIPFGYVWLGWVWPTRVWQMLMGNLEEPVDKQE